MSANRDTTPRHVLFPKRKGACFATFRGIVQIGPAIAHPRWRSYTPVTSHMDLMQRLPDSLVSHGSPTVGASEFNIFKFGARFGRKRCAASAPRPLCIPDRCRLLCALSAHCLPC